MLLLTALDPGGWSPKRESRLPQKPERMLLSQSKDPSSTWNQTRVFRKQSRKQIRPLKGSERPEELLEEGSAWEEGGRAW